MRATKQRIATASALVLALFCLYLFWPTDEAPPQSGGSDGAALPDGRSVAAAIGATTTTNGATKVEASGENAQREAIAAPAAAGRGDLVVRLLYGDDRSPAAGVMVTAFRKNEIPRYASAPSIDSKRRRTDAEGIARFPSMCAGRTGLIADRGHWYEKAYVVAGKETEVEFVMPVGVSITGIVVSALGVPVAGADVELESTVVATTDGQGRFALRGVAEHYVIGARALGHGASKAQNLMPRDGRAEVRLELGAVGGIVEGIVLDPDGKALAGVRVTIGRYEWSNSMVADAPPRPARPRTDADGHFRAIGVTPGEQAVQALAPGLVPWSGTCQVTADTPASVTIQFARGNTLRGTLRDVDGHLFGDVLLDARQGELDWDALVHPDGTFEIAGLPDGDIALKVDAEGKGEAHARVSMQSGGGVTTCELALECRIVAKGRVRDEAGQGLPNVYVSWTLPAPKHEGYTSTDKDGAFAITNAPEGKLSVRISGEEIVEAQFKDLDPRAGELDLRAKRRAPKTVYIAGVVLGPDGRPAAARAWASGGGSRSIVEKNTDAAGYFEIGPVPPGEWHMVVETRSFPRVVFERRTLEPNTRWDVGTVRLAQGGDLRVEVVEGSAEGTWFSIHDSRQRAFSGLDVQHGRGTSEQLPVGSYRLFVGGMTHAAQSVPFDILAGATTKVDVRLRAGVRQQFEIALPAKVESPWGTLRILRGSDCVGNAWASRAEGKPCTAEACLEPGDYTVVAKFGELEGSATFNVGEREGEPVRIVVPQPR